MTSKLIIIISAQNCIIYPPFIFIENELIQHIHAKRHNSAAELPSNDV